MKNLFRLLVLVLLAGGWALAASALYVVRTTGGFVVVPKNRLGFTDTYVDARKWTLADAPAHPELVKRLIAAGKAGQLAGLAPAKGPVDLASLQEALLKAVEK